MFGFVRSLILLAARIAQTLLGLEPGTSVFIGRRCIHNANLSWKNWWNKTEKYVCFSNIVNIVSRQNFADHSGSWTMYLGIYRQADYPQGQLTMEQLTKIKLRNMFGFKRFWIMLAAKIAQTLVGLEPGTSVFIGRRFIHKANLPYKNWWNKTEKYVSFLKILNTVSRQKCADTFAWSLHFVWYTRDYCYKCASVSHEKCLHSK